MTVTSDRAWDLPKSSWIMRMTWSELLFAHWPVEPKMLAPLLPRGLTIDTHNETAWVGVVPFLMTDVAPRCCRALPKLSRFLELNVRTYVTLDDKPGVWFFSLDAASRLAVRAARATFHLPYMNAQMSMDKIGADEIGSQEICYSSERTHRGEPPAQFDASYQAIGQRFHAQPDTFEHWLTARYCLYSSDSRGRVYRGEIDHNPWLLSHAQCYMRKNTMGASLGLDLSEAPHLLCAQPIGVRAWKADRCD